MVNRRNFVAVFLGCPWCVAHAAAPEWDYAGKGPLEWPSLDPAFGACKFGKQQSPVDLRDGVKADLAAITADLPPDRLTVWNNGHTLQVNAPARSSLQLAGSVFPLTQFHFHTPSEHAIDGKGSAMEVHFVFSGPDAGLTVLGALIAAGRRNPAFSAIMDIAPPQRGGKATAPMAIAARELLPAQLGPTWRYRGSLTTPPCSENVDWIVCDKSVSVAADDIRRFRNIVSANARPRQPLNRRYLLRG